MPFPVTIIPREEFSSHPLLARLLELHDVPDHIYYTGTLPDITLDEYGRATPRILTIVGSRKNTTYGKEVVHKLVGALKDQPVVIISGLAYGIDSIAHIAALKNNITTLAFLGNGLDESVLYPGQHLSLAQDITKNAGALVTELHPLQKAAQWTFPARNRLKAAISDAVLIIEAEEKSGTLITARQALELGKDIGAVPGDIFSPTAGGTNMLIKEGAYIVRNEDDLFDLLHLTRTEKLDTKLVLGKDEQTLFDLLSEPHDKDTLLHKSGLPHSEFLVALTSLEMKGYIQDTFGEVRRIV